MHDSGSIPTANLTTGLLARGSGAAGFRRLHRVTIACLGVVALVATAACDTADAANQPSRPKAGGTLRVVLGSMPSHLDPQKLNAATDANVSRLFTRTLTTFRAEPGQAASEIVGDLATDTGRPSEGNKVWEFTLKPGVKWQDGSQVNCRQVKYGIERSFSDLFQTGASYARAYLEDNNPPYQGPLKGSNNDNKGLESVECVDQETIRLHLKRPVGDFGYTVAMTVFAPVPPGKDSDRDRYDRQPMSNGPYMIEKSDDKEIVLVRNPYWDRATDQVRKAYPDKVVITANENAALITNELIQDEGDYTSTIMLDSDIASNFVQQVVNDEGLSKRTAIGPTGAIRYFAINTKLVPRLECRQALEYGFNKRKYRSAMGGSMFGELATSMIPPTLKSYQEFDHYGTKTNPDGQRARAMQVLADAAKGGKPCFPTRIKLAYRDRPDIKRFVTTIVDSYQRIGIQVQLVPIDFQTYWDDISDSGKSYQLMYAGWVPDWANGSAVLPPLFDGRLVLPPGEVGTTNYSFLKDGEIDRLIDEALAEPNLQAQYRMWGALDNKLQEMAVTIPVLYTNALRLMGSNVRGAFIHPQFGQPDMAALGLADPSK